MKLEGRGFRLSFVKKRVIILCVCVCVCVCVLVAHSCPSLCDTVDCSSPDSSVHGISQVRILEWVANFLSKGTSDPGIELVSPALAGRFFTTELLGKPLEPGIQPLR